MNINHVKETIYDHILRGDVSESVINSLLVDGGEFIAIENELWDYKETFDSTNDSYLKMMKSIVSFYNSYGGYIVYGVKEKLKDTSFEACGIKRNLINQQELRGKFDKFFGQRLDVQYVEMNIDACNDELLIGLLYIPKRKEGVHSLSPIKDGSTSANKTIFNKNAVYYRVGDECKQVISQQEFEFIVSPRVYLPTAINEQRKNVISHNLPDKSYICPVFIGRFEIIQELWSWLADEFQYAKVLAADGGKGKTSIAYEFCQLLVKSGTDMIEQVIWLTAKSKQYKAAYNSYVALPDTHYMNLETLLKEICIRTGSLIEEVDDCSLQQLQRTCRENLLLFPSFIVIDDVDSNSPDEQRRIVEVARIISNQSSRVLLTTRVNTIYSSDSSIHVPGLAGKDYIDLVDMFCKQLKISKLSSKNAEKIRIASEGSPLFTESILRLFKLGMSIQEAIEQWHGKSGEAVREAALRKEVAELNQEAIKILLALSHVGSCSRIELLQLTDMESTDIDGALEELGGLFLIKSRSFIEKEPRFETSSSTSSLVIAISDEVLPNSKDYIARVKQVYDGLKANLRSNVPEVGNAIRQCNALIKEKRFADARDTVTSIIKKPRYKENADLYFMRAKIEYRDPYSIGEMVRKSFSEAYLKGQRKSEFFEMWYQAEKKYGSKDSIFNVCSCVLKEVSADDPSWCERYAETGSIISKTVVDVKRKIEILIYCYDAVAKAMKAATTSQWHRLKQLSVGIVDDIWEFSFSEGLYVISAEAIINAIENGDVRTLNYKRIVDVSRELRVFSGYEDDWASQLDSSRQKIFEMISESIIFLESQPSPRTSIIALLKQELAALYAKK